ETPIIAPTIPPSPDYTTTSLDYSPVSKTESDPYEDPSSGHIPPLPAVSPFLSLDDDTTDNHSSPDLPSTSGPSLKRRKSPMTYVPTVPLVFEALSPVRANLIPSPKRVRDIGYLADGHRIVGVALAVTALTKRVAELERDNRRLRGTKNKKVRMEETKEMEMEIIEEMRMEETEEMEIEGMEKIGIMA
nr:hypothetical protein [Tanacetum cinerariifolium]